MAEVTLRIIDGADRGRVYSALDTPVTIGREEGNIIQDLKLFEKKQE